MALLKYCSRAGCNKLVPAGAKYCQRHTITEVADKKERYRTYDQHHRDKKAKAFYNSTEWQYTRAAVLARDNNIDIYVYITEGRVIPADTVHHIIELSEDWERRCNMDNLISISESTHNMIGIAYNNKIKRQNMQEKLIKCLEMYKKMTV